MPAMKLPFLDRFSRKPTGAEPAHEARTVVEIDATALSRVFSAPMWLRDRGLLFAQTGLFARAIADLEGYLQMLPPFTSGTDVERIRKNLEMLKKFLDI